METSGTLTFLLTDVEGSTRTWERFKQSMAYAVGRHSFLIRQAVELHGGELRKEKGEGDSTFSVFARPSDAVAAALAAQLAIANEPWPEIEELKVRMAIHCGEADHREGDFFGPTVNRCARIRAVGHGGQILLSDAARRLMGGNVPADAQTKDLGWHRLKDLQEQEHIFQVWTDGLQEQFPVLLSMSAAKHNLPIQLTTFIGREAQLDKVQAAVFDSRLVTLLGAGGSGKTRLAIQVGAEVVDDFPDGVWFVGLIGTAAGKDIAQKLLEALPISGKGREPLDAVIDEYKDARALIILDNCEHVARDAAGLVYKLLRSTNHLAVLATSREPLSVAGERGLQIPTMECDLRGQEATIDRVGNLEAVKLFCDRAANRLSDKDVLTDKTADTIARLCKRLDGIPLAIEQAAANLWHLSPKEILEGIERHAPPIWDEEGVDERHKTIQATIDWSYSLLKPDEQVLFGRLAIFAGGWTGQAAASICAGDGLEATQVEAVLGQLVRRSLAVRESWDLEENRFRMLEPIRAYALEKLDPCEREQLDERHFAWFGQLAHQAYDVGLDGDNGRYMKWLKADHDNIRAALAWGSTNSPHEVEALWLAIRMNRFWYRQQHLREGSRWLQQTMEAAADMPDVARAEALLALGALMWQSGNLEAAERALSTSLELWDSLANETKRAATLANLGGLAFTRHDYRKCVEFDLLAVEAFRELHDLGRLATALSNLGVAYEMLDDFEKAETCLLESIALYRQLGHKAELCKAQDSLLGIYGDQDKLLANGSMLVEACEFALISGEANLVANLLTSCAHACTELAMRSIENALEWGARLVGARAVAIGRLEAALQAGDHRFFDNANGRIVAGLAPVEYERLVREGRALGPNNAMKDFLVWFTENRPQ